MGTNYYTVSTSCKCCGHADEPLHIGKKSSGWSFSFHALEGLRSWLEWKDYLSTRKIVDEMGENIPFEKFVQIVGHPKDGMNHTIYCRNHHIEHAESNCSLDMTGFSFQEGEFS